MDKKIFFVLLSITLVLIMIISFIGLSTLEKDTNILEATVLTKNNKSITVCDKNNVIYTFNNNEIDVLIGGNILLEYTGVLDKEKSLQNVNINSYIVLNTFDEEEINVDEWNDNGIFQRYYNLASKKVSNMTIDEKIAQLLIVHYPSDSPLEKLERYQFGGYLFFENDFKNKMKDDVIKMMNQLQEVSKIPILTAVDEEGGKVVRVSSNSNLSREKFKSSSELYNTGGFELIKNDTIKKSELLNNLGINLNLAPVVDIANEDSYIYERTLKEDASVTSIYAKTVINASHDTGVSYVLKHFPGYGNNTDTHISNTIDNRSIEDIMNNDILPFEA